MSYYLPAHRAGRRPVRPLPRSTLSGRGTGDLAALGARLLRRRGAARRPRAITAKSTTARLLGEPRLLPAARDPGGRGSGRLAGDPPRRSALVDLRAAAHRPRCGEHSSGCVDAVDSPHNGVTFCTGSLGTLAANDLPALVKQFAAADQLRPPAQRPAHRRSRLLRGRPSVGVRQRRSESGHASAGRDRLCRSAAPGSRATDLGRGRAAHRLRAVRPGARRNVLTRFVGGAASGRLTALAA